jgi:Holliday junction resolvase RusA-like endonuclease
MIRLSDFSPRQRALAGLSIPTKPKRAARGSGKLGQRKADIAADLRRLPLLLQLPIGPSANRYWRKTKTGRIYVSPEAVAYKETVAKLAGVRTPFQADVTLMLDVYGMHGGGDVGNRVKVLEDALQGVAYVNDKQVAELHVRRLPVDELGPRVLVRVDSAHRGMAMKGGA